MEQKQESFRPIRFCPKHEAWIFQDECDQGDECWDVPDWDACVVLRKEVQKGALLVEEFCEDHDKEVK